MAGQVAICISLQERKIVCPWKFVRLSHISYTYGQLWHDILDGPLATTFELDLPCQKFLFKEATATLALESTNKITGNAETDLIEVVTMRFFSIIIQHSTPCATCLPTPERALSQWMQQPTEPFLSLYRNLRATSPG